MCTKHSKHIKLRIYKTTNFTKHSQHIGRTKKHKKHQNHPILHNRPGFVRGQGGKGGGRPPPPRPDERRPGQWIVSGSLHGQTPRFRTSLSRCVRRMPQGLPLHAGLRPGPGAASMVRTPQTSVGRDPETTDSSKTIRLKTLFFFCVFLMFFCVVLMCF